ncbi:MAG TPA: hypothetical protein VGE25_09730 [Sediminibacterium sp.]|nr:hypothetical protein [Bacteroidota bacterium]
MEELWVKIKKELVSIDKEVFTNLLDIPYVQEYAAYQKAISSNTIKLRELKELAERAEVPYPLLFAPLDVVQKQIDDNEQELEKKMATKDEIILNFRGRMKNGDIALIVKDIGRKQMFLKNHVLKKHDENLYVGIINKWISEGVRTDQIATKIREYFLIDLLEFRKYSKEKALMYLRDKIESKNIFISVSSFRYMPQVISREIALSGFGVKDKHFPFIFLNTREGDEKPLIIESEGRQIFTLISMLVSIGQNIFVLSSKKGQTKAQENKKIYSLAAEVLIPNNELKEVQLENLEKLKEKAHFFKVTPRMLLTCLLDAKRIELVNYQRFVSTLDAELSKMGKQQGRLAKPTTGYRKYNGEKFSREVVKAFNAGNVSKEDFKKIVFRKGNVSEVLFKDYLNTFK